jgi:hypothetical protein
MVRGARASRRLGGLKERTMRIDEAPARRAQA